jgi:putative tricarboxylic transport membrane protein
VSSTRHTTDVVDDEGTRPERSRSWLGVTAGACFVVVAVGTAIGSVELGYWTPIGPGAGFFPLILAVVLGVSSLVWGIGQWRGVEVEPVERGEEPAGLRSIVTIVASLVVLAMVLEIIGFQFAVLLFLFFHLRIIGKQKWWLTIAVSLLGSFGVYALFSNVLSVSLPTSSIPLLGELGL